MENFKIECVVVGDLQENCYIVTYKDKVILIDPGDEEDKIEKHLNGRKVDEILITHHHFDHVGALDYFEKKYNLKHNKFSDNYKVIKTPGHSKDSITIYFEEYKTMFCGDFIFKNSIGRMDLDGGSVEEMIESLNMISKCPGDIILYPGHGDKTTLEEEKRHFKYYF